MPALCGPREWPAPDIGRISRSSAAIRRRSNRAIGRGRRSTVSCWRGWKSAASRPRRRRTAPRSSSGLYYDLVGLPPPVAEVDAFVNDPSADAYERLVDRLLDSPHFGERWGRHWLDLARYADSDGYEKDNPRLDAWRYRDWVIEAVNADLPLDRFTIAQLAGDLLDGSTPLDRLATAFNRQTLTNTEGGVDPEQFRVEAIFDRVATLGSVWLGLTVGCAQCHSHKYDAISHDEYYRLFAFFNNGDEVEAEVPLVGEPLATFEREQQESRRKLAELEPKLAEAHARAGGRSARLGGRAESTPRGTAGVSSDRTGRREVECRRGAEAAVRRFIPGGRQESGSRQDHDHGAHRSAGNHRLSCRSAGARLIGRARAGTHGAWQLRAQRVSLVRGGYAGVRRQETSRAAGAGRSRRGAERFPRRQCHRRQGTDRLGRRARTKGATTGSCSSRRSRSTAARRPTCSSCSARTMVCSTRWGAFA